MKLKMGPGLRRIRPAALAQAAPDLATAPTLTKTSAAGVNPLAWSTEYTDLIPDADDYVVMRYREDGGAWVNETPVLVTSAWVATYIVDGDPHPWPLYDADTFAADTLVEVQEGVTRGADATVWSNIISDTMAVSDVTFAYGNKATSATNSTAISFTNCAFAGGGRALIFLTGFSNAGGTVDSLPASITITPSAGGAAINCTSLGEGGRAASRAFAIYLSDTDVAAINYDITGTRPNEARSNVVMWGTLIGANPTPTTAATFTSGSGTNPHVSASLTCPANGLLIGAFMLENDATVAGNTDTTVLDQIFFNAEVGLVVATRETTGTLSVNATPNNTYNWAKGVVAFGPV